MRARWLLLVLAVIPALPAGRADAAEPALILPRGRPAYADLHPFGIRGPRGKASTAGARMAIRDGLVWLVAHQAPDGRWGAADFATWCDGKPIEDTDARPRGRGKAIYDVGTTALALLALQGAGYTHTMPGRYGDAVYAGLTWLRSQQDDEGCFGSRGHGHYMYGHAYAALAIVEAFGMTGDAALHRPAQRAVDFVALARNPYSAWRYLIKPGDNDTSVTGNMIAPLHAATKINRAAAGAGLLMPLVIDDSAQYGALAWLNKVTDPDYGRVGYQLRGAGPTRMRGLRDRFPGEKSEAMTAMGMVIRIAGGEDPRKSRLLKLGADLCAKLPPTWNPNDGSIDMYYWYYGTLALYQVGGKPWDLWCKGVARAVVGSQRQDTTPCAYKGSWDPVGAWGEEGGRVYATALMLLVLETPWRTQRQFGPRGPAQQGVEAALADASLAPAVRARLVRGLAHRPTSQADALLARAVASESVDVRRAAAQAILERPASSEARKALAARFGDADLFVRVLALGVDAGDAVRTLTEGLQDGHTGIRLATLDEITRRGVSARRVAERIQAPAANGDGPDLAVRVASVLARRRAGLAGGAGAADAVVRRGLASAHAATRVRAATLGRLLLPEATGLLPALIDVVLLDVDPRVRLAAAHALGAAPREDPAVQGALYAARVPLAEDAQRLRGDERIALQGLVALLADKRPQVVALARLAIRRLGPATTDDLIALLGAKTAATDSAVAALARQGADAVPKLLAAVGHEKASVRLGAVQALGRITPPTAPVVRALVAAAGDADAAVRRAAGHAVEALGWVALPADGLPPEAGLLAQLAGEDAARRMHAVVALVVGGVEVEGAHDALALRMGDADDDVAAQASAALHRLGAGSVRALVRVLEDGSHAGRLRAIEVLRRLGPEAKGSEQALAALLEDTALVSPTLRALQGIGKPSVRPLMRAMRSARPGTQYKIVDVLAALGPASAPAARVVVQYLLEQGGFRRSRVMALRALIAIGDRAVSAVRPLLKHENPRYRGSAAHVLGEIGARSALGALKAARKRERDKEVRRTLNRAIEAIESARR